MQERVQHMIKEHNTETTIVLTFIYTHFQSTLMLSYSRLSGGV